MKAFKWAVALLVTSVFGTSLSAQEIDEVVVYSNPYKKSVDNFKKILKDLHLDHEVFNEILQFLQKRIDK